MDWTPELSEKLFELAKQGLSGGTILRELDIPGLSRSAVIGKIHRAGLSVGGGRRSAGKKSTRPKETRQHDGAVAYRIAHRLATRVIVAPPPEPPSNEFLGIPLENLTTGMCRYPRGEGPFLFCGQPVQDGSSYCLYCHHICWTPRERSRDKVKA